MTLPIRLISTDFDGTLFAEFENPPIPARLENLIGELQARGAKWVINTGRDMSSLMETLARSKISVQPDYLVLVEREIHVHDGVRYAGLEDWNAACVSSHQELFARVQLDVPRLMEWVNARFRATVYSDAYSPFCLIAGNNGDADIIHDFLDDYCRAIPNLTVVRNDVYARFSHVGYNKGTALAELTKRLGVTRNQVFAVGDHLNDLPMLSLKYARWLAAPGNAIEVVKETVRTQKGFVSQSFHGDGVAEALEFVLEQNGFQKL
jgi:hydroxymethylpyrimidine pyrophosphatase-like HAD family hydrolase